jgi:hypothetical protein
MSKSVFDNVYCIMENIISKRAVTLLGTGSSGVLTERLVASQIDSVTGDSLVT